VRKTIRYLTRTIRGKLTTIGCAIVVMILILGVLHGYMWESIAEIEAWRIHSLRTELLIHELRFLEKAAETRNPEERRLYVGQYIQKRAELVSELEALQGPRGIFVQSTTISTQADQENAIRKTFLENIRSLETRLRTAPGNENLIASEGDLLYALSKSLRAAGALHEKLLWKDVRRYQRLVLVMIFLGTSVLLLGIWIAARTTRRIQLVANTANEINRGNLNSKAPEAGSDELSDLAISFNQMTEKLIQEKEYSESILSSMGEMLVVVSEAGTILHANTACLDATGYERDELLGKEICLLIPEKDFCKDIMAGIKRYGVQKDSSIRVVQKGGTEISVAVSGTAFSSRSSSGTSKGAILVLKDMTDYNLLMEESQRRSTAEATAQLEKEKSAELTVLNQKLRETQAQVIETSKFAALGEMASGIAHEINNPLAIIHGKAGQLKDLIEVDKLDPLKISEIATKIEVTAMRVAKIVKSLRTFAHDGKSEPTQRLALKGILDDALDMCRERFKIHGITLIVPEISRGVVLECRGVQISQVLINLLNNAHDAVCEVPEKWIKVELDSNPDHVEISVTDSGEKISPEIRARLMEPFFTTKPVGKGSGLGLSISRSIIESHQGQLELDSESQQTRFVIRLPWRQPREGSDAPTTVNTTNF